MQKIWEYNRIGVSVGAENIIAPTNCKRSPFNAYLHSQCRISTLNETAPTFCNFDLCKGKYQCALVSYDTIEMNATYFS